MRELMARLLLILLPLFCQAQDKRWALTIQGADTMVVAPLNDLRTGAAYRVVQNRRVKTCASEIALLHGLVEAEQCKSMLLTEALEGEVKTRVVAERELKDCQWEVEQKKKGRNWWRNTAITVAVVFAIKEGIQQLKP